MQGMQTHEYEGYYDKNKSLQICSNFRGLPPLYHCSHHIVFFSALLCFVYSFDQAGNGFMFLKTIGLIISVWRYPKSERNRIRNFFPIPTFSDTKSDTFFKTKFFWYRMGYVFFETKCFWYWIWYHLKQRKVLKLRSFETETPPKIPKSWTKPNPKLFPIPNFYGTESNTFFGTESDTFSIPNLILFRYQIFPMPNRNHRKNEQVSKPSSCETETSHSGDHPSLKFFFSPFFAILSNILWHCCWRVKFIIKIFVLNKLPEQPVPTSTSLASRPIIKGW